jgi:hypothetical protein
MEADMIDSLFKAAFGALIASALAWIIGTRITYYWDDLKRRRESDLAARNEFYRVYGEFFAAWKLWDTHKRFPSIDVPEQVQWDLLCQAEEAEAGFEALLVKIASERHLTDRDVKLLACFRQAYQSLREKIRQGKRLEWAANYPSPRAKYQEYETFKALAEYFANLLATDTARRWFRWRTPQPSSPEAIGRFLNATKVVDAWEPVAREQLLSMMQLRSGAAQGWPAPVLRTEMPVVRWPCPRHRPMGPTSRQSFRESTSGD